MKKEDTGVIYKITHVASGKCYIGKTANDLETRIRSHFTGHGNVYLYYAMQKYGKDAFVYEVLERVPIHMLNEREIYYIAHFNSMKTNGYNLTEGGEGVSGYKLSDDKRKKQSERMKKRWEDPEYREEMSAMSRGENNAMYGRRGKDAPAYGRTGEKHPMYGKTLSQETLDLMSKKLTGRKHSDETKRKIARAHYGKRRHRRYKSSKSQLTLFKD